MVAMLQLLTQYRHIEELAGLPQETQEKARESKERDQERIGGEAVKTSAPDACFKAFLRAGIAPRRCRN